MPHIQVSNVNKIAVLLAIDGSCSRFGGRHGHIDGENVHKAFDSWQIQCNS